MKTSLFLLLIVSLCLSCGGNRKAPKTLAELNDSIAKIKEDTVVKSDTTKTETDKSEIDTLDIAAFQKSNNPNVYSQKKVEIRLDTITVKKYGLTFKTGVVHNIEYEFIYPMAKNSIMQRIQDDMVQKFFETTSIIPIEKAQLNYLHSIYKAITDGDVFPQSEEFWCSADEPTYNIRWSAVRVINNKIIELIIQEKGYWGGVHGWTDENYYCYDIATGEQITLNDLFNKSNQEIMFHHLRDTKDDYGRNMYPEELTNNFLLLPKGILFLYNEYDAGCYADGIVCYTVKYSEIKHLLKPSALQYFYK
ncbi:MAG: RsiV family protein [Streptococcaceae bacterium]|nr:RsiV family protein [Streptococcaceae bacterium]